MSLCNCIRKVLHSLASMSLSNTIAITHCTSFFKVCLYIQFSLFTKQFLHGCYMESYDLYMVRDIS